MGNDDTELSLDLDPGLDLEEKFHRNIDKVFNEIKVNADFSDENDNNEENDNDDVMEQVQYSEDYLDFDQVEEVEGNEFVIDSEIMDINASLAKQVSDALEDTSLTSYSQRKKLPRWAKIQLGVIASLLCLVSVGLFLVYSKPGNKILMSMGVGFSGQIWEAWTNDFNNDDKLPTDVVVEPNTNQPDTSDVNKDSTTTDTPTIGRKEDYAYNILLLGEEAIGSGSGRGRTDLIIIATLNTKENSVKLTSIMRDTLVQIPGYLDNKINSAYEKGGIDLLYETIEKNFDIKLDGGVLVDFNNFENIINMLDGLEIELTSAEAKYLNTTNYISKKEYRNVVAGKQVLNGNQVLGYSRIRKRATITGANNDYGRTDRHRIILNAIFNKYKTRSKADLASTMIKIIPMLSTDIDSSEFAELLNIFVETGISKIDQLRIPADGTFTENVEVRGMDVLIPDIEKNIEILHNHVFGKE